MDELRRTQAESTMAQPEFSRSMAEMDYAQVGLPRFLVKNEMSQPPQDESNVKNGEDELAFAMVELTKTMAKMPKEEASVNIQIQPIPLKRLKEEMTPKATSYTQLGLQKEQLLQEKGMSI